MPPVAPDTEELRVSDIGGGPPRRVDSDGYGGGGDDEDNGGHPRYAAGAGLLAMRFALVSITLLFVTIGIAYTARAQTHINWQHIRVPSLLWLSTSLIAISSVTIEIARSGLTRKDRHRYSIWLAATVALGLLFLASQVFALRELMAQGLFLRHNPHSSLFYVVTGAHAIHLLGGIAALLFLLLRSTAGRRTSPLDFRRERAHAAICATYWHFLTVIWLALFGALLLWP